jgi:hypothetical protein
MREGFDMSKMGRHVYALQEAETNAVYAMSEVSGRSIDDLTESQVKRLVWTARLWLRNQWDPHGFGERMTLTSDARGEIMRRAMEAEQTADYREAGK